MTADHIRSLKPALAVLLAIFRPCFKRTASFDHWEWYIVGLVTDLKRKSVEPIALAIYIWAKRDKEHQNILTRFLFSCAFRRPRQSARPGDMCMYRLPTVDDFARVLALFMRYGLTGRPARQLAYELTDCW